MTEIIEREEMKLSREIMESLNKLSPRMKWRLLLELLSEKEKHIGKNSVLNYIKIIEESYK